MTLKIKVIGNTKNHGGHERGQIFNLGFFEKRSLYKGSKTAAD